MKKILLAFFAILFIGNFALAQVAWDGYSIASQYAGGTGTKSDPYRISTAPQFMYFLKSIKDGNTYSGKYIKLTNEISLCGNAINLTGQPITSYSNFGGGEFNGYFDGDNHFINSVYYLEYLFRTLNGTVCNLGIENDNVSSGAGSIAYTVEQSGLIVSCTRVLTGANDGGYRRYPVRRPFSYINKGAIINCKIQGRINTTNEYGYNNVSAGIAVDNYGTILNIDYASYSFYNYTLTTKKIVSNNYRGAIVDFGDLGPGNNSTNNTPVTNSTTDYETWKNNHTSINYTLPSQSDSKIVYFNDPMDIYTHDAISVPTNQYLSSYIANPSIDDCIFAGWKYNNTTYTSTNTIRVTDNMILTPTWTQKITQQPTKEKPTVLVSDSKHALYQWYTQTQTDGKVDYPNWTSTNTTHGSSSSYTYEIIATEGQQISIDWKTDSEAGCDELNITIDGTRVLTKGGQNQTGTLTYTFTTTGSHKVVVSYTKDDSVSDYSDKVWVSNVWLGAAPILLEGETSKTLSLSKIKKDGIAWCSVKYTNSNEILKSNSIEVEGWNNTVTLIDGTDFTTTETKIVDELTFSKTFSASSVGKWNAFYVPMSIDVEEYAGELDFAEIYAFCATVDTNGDGTVDANDENFLFVRPVKTGCIEPNVPYLIRPKEAKTYVINSADNILYKSTEGKVEFSTTLDKYTVTGLNNAFTVTAGDNNYYVSASGALNIRTTGSTTVKANRWIMHRESKKYGGANDGTSYAREYRIVTIGEDMDETTAIETIRMSNASNTESDDVYTIDGRRVNAEHGLSKGIYIKNGKKYFVK